MAARCLWPMLAGFTRAPLASGVSAGRGGAMGVWCHALWCQALIEMLIGMGVWLESSWAAAGPGPSALVLRLVVWCGPGRTGFARSLLALLLVDQVGRGSRHNVALIWRSWCGGGCCLAERWRLIARS